MSERVEHARQLEDLRAQLALADRMASIGTLAAGIAHEINNPLTYVLANLDFAGGEVSPGPEGAALREAFGEVAEGARRVREIVRDLQAGTHGASIGGGARNGGRSAGAGGTRR